MFNPGSYGLLKGGWSVLNPVSDLTDLGLIVTMVVARGTFIVIGLGLMGVGVYLTLGRTTERAVKATAAVATGGAVAKRVRRRRAATAAEAQRQSRREEATTDKESTASAKRYGEGKGGTSYSMDDVARMDQEARQREREARGD